MYLLMIELEVISYADVLPGLDPLDTLSNVLEVFCSLL
jgi:hypothetical protein